ncbi:hypothetical protein EJ06DRAFT_558071 [Trichodelitschia bisporula]|uniref:Uncharacterized protein n=1 Tax=Trichodelitschia bisporula TaxID=703511 RepID=A0A6G1HSR7_9PEZI|nr:hypothetical protein EJ06DRAFT_558071 [Trichodelitschia bisporula]
MLLSMARPHTPFRPTFSNHILNIGSTPGRPRFPIDEPGHTEVNLNRYQMRPLSPSTMEEINEAIETADSEAAAREDAIISATGAALALVDSEDFPYKHLKKVRQRQRQRSEVKQSGAAAAPYPSPPGSSPPIVRKSTDSHSIIQAPCPRVAFSARHAHGEPAPSSMVYTFNDGRTTRSRMDLRQHRAMEPSPSYSSIFQHLSSDCPDVSLDVLSFDIGRGNSTSSSSSPPTAQKNSGEPMRNDSNRSVHWDMKKIVYRYQEPGLAERTKTGVKIICRKVGRKVKAMNKQVKKQIKKLQKPKKPSEYSFTVNRPGNGPPPWDPVRREHRWPDAHLTTIA